MREVMTSAPGTQMKRSGGNADVPVTITDQVIETNSKLFACHDLVDAILSRLDGGSHAECAKGGPPSVCLVATTADSLSQATDLQGKLQQVVRLLGA